MDVYEAKKRPYAVGTIVPEFDLKDDSGQDYVLNPGNFDKLVLLDLCASWCGPCIEGFPQINELKDKYSKELEVISISIDPFSGRTARPTLRSLSTPRYCRYPLFF